MTLKAESDLSLSREKEVPDTKRAFIFCHMACTIWPYGEFGGFIIGADQTEVSAASASRRTTDAVALAALARVFKAWRANAEESATLAGVSERTWARMKSENWNGALSQDQSLRASALIGLYKGLHLYFGDALADKWVKMPNRGPLFRGQSPLQYMLAGALPALIETREYVDAIRGGV